MRKATSILMFTAVVGVMSESAGQNIGAVGDRTAPETIVSAELMAEEPGQAPLSARLEEIITNEALDSILSEELDPAVAMAARMAYARQLFRPLWTKEGAQSLAGLKDNLSAYGLVAEDVTVRDIETLARMRFDGTTAEERARAEWQLTAVWLRMASAVSRGLSGDGAAARASSLKKTPPSSSFAVALVQAGKGDAEDALQALEPRHPQYGALKKALLQYFEIKINGGWATIPSGGLIEYGDRDSRIPLLRARLKKENYFATVTGKDSVESAGTPTSDEGRTRYDRTLEAAVLAFQRGHGLKEDGIIGPDTFRALNESVDSKIERIADTLNRWRQQGDLGHRYVWANIPSFTVEGWQAGQREIRMKTIVGRPSRTTPVFSDKIEYVVTHPKWYVPVSILQRDKLPKLAQDPSYAQRMNFRVYERSTGREIDPFYVDWTDPSSARRYRLVQAPGAGNALGELKIIFPNRYSVYMHGTPSKNLFDRATRAFSSGCIRLQHPVAMAKWLASYDNRLTPERLEEVMNASERKHLRFGQTTNVHVTYMTVTADDSGAPVFWRDIYSRLNGSHFVEKFGKKHFARNASTTPAPAPTETARLQQ